MFVGDRGAASGDSNHGPAHSGVEKKITSIIKIVQHAPELQALLRESQATKIRIHSNGKIEIEDRAGKWHSIHLEAADHGKVQHSIEQIFAKAARC